MQTRWVVLTATKAEAAPMINHFGLIKVKLIDGYSVYQRDGLLLMVTGTGYNAAYRAIECLLPSLHLESSVEFINVGIAGAKSLELGSLVWPQSHAGEVINAELPIGITNQFKAYEMVTVSTATEQYQAGSVYDMEFAGIYNCMTANGHNAKLFCAKVISDNEAHAVSNITPQSASELIRQHLGQFTQLFSFV